jgi:hypothetical protein
MKYYRKLQIKTPRPKPWDEAMLRGTTRIPAFAGSFWPRQI